MMTFAQGVDILSDALFVVVSLVALFVLPRVVADVRACRRALEGRKHEADSAKRAEVRARPRKGGAR